MAKNNSWNMDEDKVVITDANQTITGNKTFTGLVETPSPLSATEAVNLGYLQQNAWNIVSSQTISAPVASVEFANLGNYTKYMFLYEAVAPDTSGAQLCLQCSNDNGATWITGASSYNNARIGASNTAITAINVIGTQFELTSGVVNTVEGAGGTIYFPFTAGFTRKQMVANTAYVNSSATTQTWLGTSGYVSSPATINAFRFLFSSGNITAGIISLYGAN